MPKGKYPRKYVDGKCTSGNFTKDRGSPKPLTDEERIEIRDMVNSFEEKKKIKQSDFHQPNQPFYLRDGFLYKEKYKKDMKKVIVPCSCGLIHAVMWQVMTPMEILERAKVDRVKEYKITLSMIDIFYQRPKWKQQKTFWKKFFTRILQLIP